MLSKLNVVPKISSIEQVKPLLSRLRIEPMERGYGQTLGNALRRVMLSSIPGFAVTEVEIEGVSHEYDRLEGMREDVFLLLMNVKNIVFQIQDGDFCEVTLKKEGAGNVTAGDIAVPHNVKVINPDLVLATLTKTGKLTMKMTVRRGIGYEPASSRDSQQKPFGAISLDAIYSPVRKVSFTVDSARVENRTDLDCLILEVESNGVYTCEELVQRSSHRLVEHLSVFAKAGEVLAQAENTVVEEVTKSTASQSVLSEEVSSLGLTVRSQNCLRQENIRYVGELVQYDEKVLMRTPHLGKKSLVEIKEALARMDLQLGMQVTNWVPPTNSSSSGKGYHA